MFHEVAQVDDGTSAPIGGALRARYRQRDCEVLTGDEPRSANLDELVRRPMPRSPHPARSIDAFVSLGMNDVGEDGTIVFAYFDADGAGAVVRERIEQFTELRPTPRAPRTRGWELVVVVDDAHRTARVDADAGEGKADGRFGRGRLGTAVTHASQVCRRTPGPRIPARSAFPFGARPRDYSIDATLKVQLKQLEKVTATGGDMSERVEGAIDVLRTALQGPNDPLDVALTISRGTAENILRLLEAEDRSGAVVVPVKELYTTTEASTMLGVSRATLMKLIDSGSIEAVKVGTHHRVPADELVAFQRARQVSQERAAELLTEFSSRSATGFHSNVTFRASGQEEE